MSVHIDKYAAQQGLNVTVAVAVSPVNGLMFLSAYIGGMNAPRFNDFLAQTRQNLDPDKEVVFIYDSAPAHRNPTIPAANTELEMLPPYSPFLNIVEQAISLLKAAIKGGRIEARNTGWNGRQRGGQTPRYPVRRDANPIATRCSSALHRCYNCC